LAALLSGVQFHDFTALAAHCRYEGGYSASTPVVRWLWECCNELSLEDKNRFLIFATGSSRIPLGGLGRLGFCIQRAGPDTEQIMTASTCFHTLLLPEYKTKEKVKQKLVLALQYAEGFGLQ